MPNARLEENLRSVLRRIAEAERRAGRSPGSAKLLAVTKLVPSDIIEELAAQGVADVGENRAQSLLEKASRIRAPLRWHLIGTLQKNKARKALSRCEMIHSADSIELLRHLDRVAGEMGKRPGVLLEVNVSGESSKHGFRPEETLPALRESRALHHLSLRGLMTMAPLAADPERSRPLFRRLRELRDEAAREALFDGPGEISMGMTQDFEVAVEEGADWVRVGSALFEGVV